MVLLLEAQESGSGWAARAPASSDPKVVSGGSLGNGPCNEARKRQASFALEVVVRIKIK